MTRPHGSIDKEKLTQRYILMLEYQSKIYPFSPTVRELMDLWKLNTTSAVVLALGHMRDNDLLFVREAGAKTHYHAKPLSLTKSQQKTS